MESLTGNTVIGPPFLPADGPRFCKQFIIKNPHDVTYATAVLNLELVAASRVARIFGHTPPNNEPLVSIIHFLAIVCLESIVRFKVTSTTALFNYFFFPSQDKTRSSHFRWKRAKISSNFDTSINSNYSIDTCYGFNERSKYDKNSVCINIISLFIGTFSRRKKERSSKQFERKRLRTTLGKKKENDPDVPCIRTITNTPQTPRKTELNGAIPRTARSSSIGHHSARFYGAKEREDTIPVDLQQKVYIYIYTIIESFLPRGEEPRLYLFIRFLATLENRDRSKKRDHSTRNESNELCERRERERERRCPVSTIRRRHTAIRSIRVFGLLISHHVDSRKPEQRGERDACRGR